MTVCGFSLAWVYILYGFFLSTLKDHFRPIAKGLNEPTFTIIIPAYNEESVIERKILNTMSLKYPKEKVEIIVVDDGSSDKTCEVAMRYPNVKALRVPRGGKNKAINAALGMATGDVTIQTDADCFLGRRDSLEEVAANFADSSVGAVTSSINFLPSKSRFVSRFLGQRRTRENIWRKEMLVDSVVSGLGVFLAFKRDLVPTVHERCLADDVDISLQVRQKGYRVAYEPNLEVDTASPDSVAVWYKQYLRRTLSGFVTIMQHKSMLFDSKLGWYGMIILPSRLLLPHLTPLFCFGCLVSVAILNPLLAVLASLAVLSLSPFIFTLKKFLAVQIVQTNVLVYYLLGRYGPEHWMKEPRQGNT